jgi:hypothetical protein
MIEAARTAPIGWYDRDESKTKWGLPMSLRIRFQYTSKHSLAYSIERLADGLFYDFAPAAVAPATGTGGTFTAKPATMTAPLPEDTGIFLGRYKTTLTPTPATVFTNGDYVVTVHDLDPDVTVVEGELGVTMFNGDDATPLAAGSTFNVTVGA